MPPSVVWGIGVGLVIAAIDTLSLVLMSMDETSRFGRCARRLWDGLLAIEELTSR
mgnify:CR=1 FL=1